MHDERADMWQQMMTKPHTFSRRSRSRFRSAKRASSSAFSRSAASLEKSQVR